MQKKRDVCVLTWFLLACLAACGTAENIEPFAVESLTIAQAADLIRQQNEKVVLVEVFSSRCGACKSQSPILLSLGSVNREKPFEIIGLCVDSGPDNLGMYAARTSLPFSPRWLSDFSSLNLNKGLSEFGIHYEGYIPYMFLIDKNAQLVAQWTGVTTQETLQAKVDVALAVESLPTCPGT
jgi:thiol-disulfide isomerase/thioredoxin